MVSSAKVWLMMPDTSGVTLVPLKVWSTTPLAAMEPWKPGRLSGRGDLMLMTEPMPPVGSEARPDL